MQESLWGRHKRLSEDLWKGLRKMGLEPFVEDPDDRLCTVNTIKVPTFKFTDPSPALPSFLGDLFLT